MTTTPARIAANKHNARLSTGPTTREGKASSSTNAVRHGLLATSVLLKGEDADAWQDLRNRLLIDLAPLGETETMLVERIVFCAWRLRRAGSLETHLFTWLAIEGRATDARRQLTKCERGDMFAAFAMTLSDREDYYRAAKLLEAAEAGRADLSLAEGFVVDAAGANSIAKLARYEAGIERSMYRARHELRRVQSMRPSAEVDPAAAGGGAESRGL